MEIVTEVSSITEDNVSSVLEKHLLGAYPDTSSRMYIVLNWSQYLERVNSKTRESFDSLVQENYEKIVKDGFTDELFLKLYRMIEGEL